MGKKQRVYWNIVQMRHVVNDWAMSGESRSAYCRRFGLAVHVLNYWIQRISEDDDSEAVFRELTAPEEAPLGSDSCVRLLYPSLFFCE